MSRRSNEVAAGLGRILIGALARSCASRWLPVAVLVAFAPAVAHGQAGWYVTPSIALTEEYDDNVFSTSSAASSDLISRLSAGITGGYRSKPLTFLITGGLDSEFFAEHAELGGVPNRKRAGLDAAYVLAAPTTLTLAATYVETQTPAELQPQTGIDTGRQATRQLSVSPSLAHRFDQTLSGTASYVSSQTTSGDIDSTAHQGRLGLASVITHLDTGSANYMLRRLQSGAAPSTMSHALTAGWTRKFSQTTSLSLEGGPRFSDGAIEPEVSAALNHRLKTGTLALSYARTEATLIGRAGTAETNSLLGALTLVPERSLTISLGTGISRTTSGEGLDVTVYRANGSASYRLMKWLTGTVSYRVSYQDDGRAPLRHNVLSIGLEATYPMRAD